MARLGGFQASGPLSPFSWLVLSSTERRLSGSLAALALGLVPLGGPAPVGVSQRDEVVYVYAEGVGVGAFGVGVEPAVRLDDAAPADRHVLAVPDQGRLPDVADAIRDVPPELLRVGPVGKVLSTVPGHRAWGRDLQLLERLAGVGRDPPGVRAFHLPQQRVYLGAGDRRHRHAQKSTTSTAARRKVRLTDVSGHPP